VVSVDRVARHQDALRLLDQRAPAEGPWRLWYSANRCKVMSIALGTSPA
jgi:hypothetical protein